MKLLLALFTGALVTIGMSACGGGGASTPSTTTAANAGTSSSVPVAPTTASTATTATPSTPAPSQSTQSSSPSSSAQTKRYPHGDNSIQTFGKEAGQTEKQAVTATVKRYYAAVASGNGAGACALLSSGLSKSIVQSLGRSAALRGKGCAGILALLFKHRPGQSAASIAEVEVTGVRLKGDRGFALLRSKDMPSGEITVDRENGAWKVGALIGGALQ